MKLLKLFFFALGFSALNATAQDVPVEELPVATIDDKFLVTVPEIPIEEYYFIDISHLTFADDEEALKKLNFYLTANVVEPIINLEDNYLILHVKTEYIGGDTDYNNLQFYLNHLTKLVE